MIKDTVAAVGVMTGRRHNMVMGAFFAGLGSCSLPNTCSCMYFGGHLITGKHCSDQMTEPIEIIARTLDTDGSDKWGLLL